MRIKRLAQGRYILPGRGSNRGPPVWKSDVLTARPRQLLMAYMPCDNNCQDEVFSEILDEVEQIIHIINPSNIVFRGDLNTDFQ